MEQALEALVYEIDALERRVIVTYQEQPDFSSFAQFVEGIQQDPAYQDGYDMLLDRRTIGHPASTEYIKRFVVFIDAQVALLRTGRWAIVVGDLGSYGMGRMAEQLSSTEAIRTFRELRDAGAWLAARRAN